MHNADTNSLRTIGYITRIKKKERVRYDSPIEVFFFYVNAYQKMLFNRFYVVGSSELRVTKRANQIQRITKNIHT